MAFMEYPHGSNMTSSMVASGRRSQMPDDYNTKTCCLHQKHLGDITPMAKENHIPTVDHMHRGLNPMVHPCVKALPNSQVNFHSFNQN